MQHLVLILFSIISSVNVPLVWVKGCDVPDKPRTSDKKPLKGEDKEMVEKALRGECIPAKVLEEIQEERFKNNQPYLVLPVRSYADERDELRELRKRAKEDFIYYQAKTNDYLNMYNSLPPSERRGICDQLNRSMEAGDEEEVGTANADLGKWIADYLVDSGYAVSVYVDEIASLYMFVPMNCFEFHF